MINKQKLIDYVKSNNRICPLPQKWDAIFTIIRNELPPNKLVPIILGAWNFTEDSEKQKRLIEQIEFVFSLSDEKAQEFERSIYALTENDWHRG